MTDHADGCLCTLCVLNMAKRISVLQQEYDRVVGEMCDAQKERNRLRVENNELRKRLAKAGDREIELFRDSYGGGER